MNHFVITCWGHVAPGKQCKTQLIQHVMPAVEPTCSEASKVNSRNHAVPGIQDMLNQFIPWQYIPSNPWHPKLFRILGYVDNFPELLHIYTSWISSKNHLQKGIPSARLIIFAFLQELFSFRAHHGARHYALESMYDHTFNDPLQSNHFIETAKTIQNNPKAVCKNLPHYFTRIWSSMKLTSFGVLLHSKCPPTRGTLNKINWRITRDHPLESRESPLLDGHFSDTCS